MFSFRRLLLDPKGTEGNGESTNPTDLTKAIEGLLAKHGDPNAALRTLLNENYAYRDEIRSLKAQLPGDDAAVLKGDDARAWKAYRELGKLDDLKRIKSEHESLATENKALKRDASLREVATAAGWKPHVLAAIAGDRELFLKDDPVKDKAGQPIIDKETGKARTRKVAHVKGEGDSSTPAEDVFADFLPALRVQSEPERTARPIGTPRRNEPPELPNSNANDPSWELEASLRDTGSGAF